jgi:hypothetical protein
MMARNRPIDLTTDDLRTIIDSVEAISGWWCIRATYVPSPTSRTSGTRWAYLFWVGPPSSDIVPSVAITRQIYGYRITVFDVLEFCASGSFEMMECSDLTSTVELVGQIIDEIREMALDHAMPDATAFASRLAQIHRKSGDELARQSELQGFILASMPTDIKSS